LREPAHEFIIDEMNSNYRVETTVVSPKLATKLERHSGQPSWRKLARAGIQEFRIDVDTGVGRHDGKEPKKFI